MQAIELGIMSCQDLGKTLTQLKSNTAHAKINWQVKTQDVRIELSKLYLTIV